MNREELEGRAKDIKGRMKEGAGDLTGDERLQEEGAADRTEGKVEEIYGKGKRKVGEALEDLGEKTKR